ncbi:MAG: alpha-L-fucosidase C-terminal domain-containing protein [Bacteroidota bacterium]
MRFTTKDDHLYAIVMAWPESGKANIRSLIKGTEHCDWNVKSASMLGSKARIQWTQTKTDLNIDFPPEQPCDFTYVFKIVFGEFAEEANSNYISMNH